MSYTTPHISKLHYSLWTITLRRSMQKWRKKKNKRGKCSRLCQPLTEAKSGTSKKGTFKTVILIWGKTASRPTVWRPPNQRHTICTVVAYKRLASIKRLSLNKYAHVKQGASDDQKRFMYFKDVCSTFHACSVWMELWFCSHYVQPFRIPWTKEESPLLRA